MKNLILIRHAKSDWSKESRADYDRPLNRRGKWDAPFMGERLLEKKIDFERILVSPARRAEKTARLICKAMNIPRTRIQLEASIYEARPHDLLALLQTVGREISDLALLGHNPGLTELANWLADCGIDNIPTCGIVSLKADIDDWQELSPHVVELADFFYPRST